MTTDDIVDDQFSNTSKVFKDEPKALASRVLKTAGDGAPSGFADFVRYRFWRPFQYSLKASSLYGWAFSVLSVIGIAGGLASSAIAASPRTNDTLLVVLGLLVAVATAVNRLWRPGLRAVVRNQTANALRREGWAFVCGRGGYAELKPEERPVAFVDEVERINVTAESVDEESLDDEAGKSG